MTVTDLETGSDRLAPAVQRGGRPKRRARLLPGGLRWILPAFAISVGLIYYSIVYSGYLSFFYWPGGRALMTPVGFGNYITALQRPGALDRAAQHAHLLRRRVRRPGGRRHAVRGGDALRRCDSPTSTRCSSSSPSSWLRPRSRPRRSRSGRATGPSTASSGSSACRRSSSRGSGSRPRRCWS